MKLIIAEKKELALHIFNYLKTVGEVGEIKGSYIKTQNYYITWTGGHILRNKLPEEYNPKYKEWKYEDLPLKFHWELLVIEGKEYLFDTIKKFIFKDEITEIIHGGDPDAEGQLIVDEVLIYLNNKKPVKRILINDTTINGIKMAFDKIEDNKNFINWGKSAYARSISDFLFGINLSRLATLTNKEKNIDLSSFGNETLTVGRVQTPILNLVSTRDYLIENHIKEKYFDLYAQVEIEKKSNPKEKEEVLKAKGLYEQNFHDKELANKYFAQMVNHFANLQDNYTCNLKYFLPKDNKIQDKNIIEDFAKTLMMTKNLEINVEKKIEKEYPPLPFNLLKLQQYCSKKYNYSPDEVSKITQKLRETYCCITYNRSDCQYLTSAQLNEAPVTIKQVLENINVDIPEINLNIVSKAFDDSKISAHTAIIPANIKVNLLDFSEEERNVYKAIVDFYLIQFMPRALIEKTILSFSLLSEKDFKISTSTYIELGYRAYLRDKQDIDEEEKENIEIKKLLAGTYKAKYLNHNIIEKETTPPKRYTYETLLNDMTSISKYVDNPKIKEILKAKDKDNNIEGNGSIGTPATTSGILQNLIDRKYLEKKGKSIISTEITREYLKTLPEELKKVDMTALWWTYQEDIKYNGKDPNILIENVFETVKKIVENKEILALPDKFLKTPKEKESFGKCPVCNSPVYKGKTKSGLTNYYCSNYKNGCTFTMWEQMKYFDNIIKITDTRAKTLLNNKDITVKLTAKSGKEYSGKLKLKINKVGDKIFVNFEPVK